MASLVMISDGVLKYYSAETDTAVAIIIRSAVDNAIPIKLESVSQPPNRIRGFRTGKFHSKPAHNPGITFRQRYAYAAVVAMRPTTSTVVISCRFRYWEGNRKGLEN